MPGFALTTVVPAVPAAVFDASLDIDLHVGSMAASGERAVAGVTSGLIGPGQTVTWQARHFGLPWRMTSRITAYDRPRRFVDEQVHGPFRRWRHEHLFTVDPADPARTVLTDVVDFAAPLGPAGWPVAVAVLRPYLRRLIVVRNRHLVATLAG